MSHVLYICLSLSLSLSFSHFCVPLDILCSIWQERVYTDLGKSLLENSFDGYNAALFAYGQTGSGKSYSIIGYGANKGKLNIGFTFIPLYLILRNNVIYSFLPLVLSSLFSFFFSLST